MYMPLPFSFLRLNIFTYHNTLVSKFGRCASIFRIFLWPPECMMAENANILFWLSDFKKKNKMKKLNGKWKEDSRWRKKKREERRRQKYILIHLLFHLLLLLFESAVLWTCFCHVSISFSCWTYYSCGIFFFVGLQHSESSSLIWNL